MLIVCVGPDTYRATQRVQELELAFREKYDPAGSSVERISAGKAGYAEIVERAGSMSLFSPRRFLRTRDLLAESNASQMRVLTQVLSRDVDAFIVVTIEEELSDAQRKACSSIPKFIVYDSKVLQGQEYLTWIKEQAALLGVENLDRETLLALANGDSWFVVNELKKLSVSGGKVSHSRNNSEGLFDVLDKFQDPNAIQRILSQEKDVEPLLFGYLSQLRASIRAKEGFTDGMHPYQAKKLAAQPYSRTEQRLISMHYALFLSREGFGSLDETSILL